MGIWQANRTIANCTNRWHTLIEQSHNLLPETVLSIDQMLFSPLDKALCAPTLPQQGPTFEQQFQSFPYSVFQWHTCTLYPPALSPVTHAPAGSHIVLMRKE